MFLKEEVLKNFKGNLLQSQNEKINKDSSSLRKSDPGDTQLQVWLTILRIADSTRQLCVLLCEQTDKYTLRGESMNGSGNLLGVKK